MNKYQKQLHKQIKNTINQEIKLLDEKYPIVHNCCRNIRYLLEKIKLKSNKHYRKIKREMEADNKSYFSIDEINQAFNQAVKENNK